MPIVKNKNTDTISPSEEVFIMRPTTWGNPFVIGVHGHRKETIRKFKLWLKTGENFDNKKATEEKRQQILSNLSYLKGKNLICCCAPLACHGDVLIELANKEEKC